MQMKFNCKFPSTAHRVSLKTCPCENKSIRSKTIKNLVQYDACSNEEISARIQQLNREWDTERMIELNAASFVIASTILGFISNKYWFLVTAAVGTFLLDHALYGWCPPITLLRKCKVRTAEEINIEKMALKKSRGDFAENTSDAAKLYKMMARK